MIACSPREKDPASLFREAERQFQQGDTGNALMTAESGRRLFAGQPDSEWYWKFRLQLAEMYLWKPDVERARPLLDGFSEANHPALTARADMLKGYLQDWGRNVVEAERLYRAAIRTAESGSDYQVEAEAQSLLGQLLGDTNPSDAEAELRNALSTAQSHSLVYEGAMALSNLGLARLKRERFGEAIGYLEKAAQQAEKAHAVVVQAAVAINLSNCYINLGNGDRARQSLESVVPTLKHAAQDRYLALVYYNLGTAILLTDPAKAAAYFREALNLAKDSAEFTEGMSEALLATGALDQAEAYAKSAEVESGSDKDLSAAIALNRAKIFRRRGQSEPAIAAYNRAMQLGIESPSILWEAHAGLGALYGESNDLASANAHYEKALAVISANRADQLKSDYKITFLSNLITFYQDYVALLMKENQPGRALEIADSSRASVLREALTGESQSRDVHLLDEIRKAAKASNSVFLFYWLAPKTSYVWAIGGGRTVVKELPGQQQIGLYVESYRRMIERDKRDPLAVNSSVALWLYQTLVAPVRDSLPPGSRVVIVPDGPLHNLNFETLLVDKPSPHYWIQDATISVAPSLSLLNGGSKRVSTQASLLLMGAPVTDGSGFLPLPQAALEIELVSRHFKPGQTKSYIAAAATPEAYIAAGPKRFSTIHFATHVDANSSSPLDSAIILSKRTNGYKLYARDVAETPLNADLVTISACRGAGSRTLTGEGLVGFAWAFFQAGARNVVTSLWDVNDTSTATLMDRFYSGIEAHQTYPIALREAKLAMLASNYRKPYYWAPFQVYTRTILR